MSSNPQPHANVDWGGDQVTFNFEDGNFTFLAAIGTDTAARMAKQLEWAINEVARFKEHMARDGRAGLYRGLPKP